MEDSSFFQSVICTYVRKLLNNIIKIRDRDLIKLQYMFLLRIIFMKILTKLKRNLKKKKKNNKPT